MAFIQLASGDYTGGAEVLRAFFTHNFSDNQNCLEIVGSNISLTQSFFEKNYARVTGSTVTLSGTVDLLTEATISGTQFLKNKNSSGSALAINGVPFGAQITNVIFKKNESHLQGAALNLSGLFSEYLISECEFTKNKVEAKSGVTPTINGQPIGGGAIFADLGVGISIDSSKFKKNEAPLGGAILLLGDALDTYFSSGRLGQPPPSAALSIQTSDFEFNKAEHSPGNGGAVAVVASYLTTDTSVVFVPITFAVSTSEFYRNKAKNNGGDLSVDASGPVDPILTIITNSAFNHSRAENGNGGGVSLINIEGEFLRNLFSYNKAEGFGGGIYIADSSGVLIGDVPGVDDNVFKHNEAQTGDQIYGTDVEINGQSTAPAIVTAILETNIIKKPDANDVVISN